MGRNLIPWVSKTCGHRQADSGRIKPGLETVNNPDPDCFRPQNQGLRTQNPKQTRPQPPVERGWADKADSRPPLRGPGGWGGDWYVWHAPDGLRARAATGLGCMQAGAEKLGVIEASYASAIIGVLRRLAGNKLPGPRSWRHQPDAPARRPAASRAGLSQRPSLARRVGMAGLLCPGIDAIARNRSILG